MAEDQQIEQQNIEETEKAEEENAGLIVFSDDVPEEARWYVVHTYSGREKKVAQLIETRLLGRNLRDKIFKVFIPTQKKVVVSKGKKRNVDEKLFPGYIIVNMVMEDDAWYLVKTTKGVTGFVGTGTEPTPLPQKEVNSLMKFMTMDEPKFEAKFRVGDSVKVKEGPFRDFLGKVDSVNKDQGKVKVLVSVFGRETPVELDFTQVENIN